MSNKHFYLKLTGQLEPGRSPDQAAAILSKVFQLPSEKGRALFSGKPTTFRKKLTQEMGDKICQFLNDAGAGCALQPIEEELSLSLADVDEAPPAPRTDRFDTDTPSASATKQPPAPPPSEPPRTTPEAAERHTATAPAPTSNDQEQRIPPSQPSDTANKPGQEKMPVGSVETSNLIANAPNRPKIEEVETFEEPEPAKKQPSAMQQINKKTLLSGLLLLLIVAGAGLYFFSSGSDIPLPQIVKPKPPLSAKPNPSKLADDPMLRDSEIDLAKLKLNSLAQSVRVWMIQFGGGYDPTQVTIKRLQTDIGLSEADLTDPWGMKIRYQSSPSGYSVTSAGPDKAFNSADDIQIKHSM